MTRRHNVTDQLTGLYMMTDLHLGAKFSRRICITARGDEDTSDRRMRNKDLGPKTITTGHNRIDNQCDGSAFVARILVTR